MKKGRIRKGVTEALLYSELSVKGGREVFTHGVKAICEYSEERVRLRLSDMTLCIEGSCLTMKSYYDDAVCVTGEIRGLGFER